MNALVNSISSSDVIKSFDINGSNLGSGGLFSEAVAMWQYNLSHITTSSELIRLLSSQLAIDPAVIRGWINLYGWVRPEDDEGSVADESLFSVESDTVYHVAGIDRTMDRNALRDMAADPLCPFWSQLRENHRRPAMTWLSTLSYLPPARIDFDVFQDMLERFQVTVEQLAGVFCVESDLLRRYCDAHGIHAPRYAGVSDVSIAKLVSDHEPLQQILVHYAQQLYCERAIPIRRVAQNLGLQWQDVWAMGVRQNGWQLPSSETLDDIERAISHHEI